MSTVVANGVISQPYVRGVVFCAGNAVYGFSCVSPIVDLTNSTPNEAVVHYASRKESLFVGEANRVSLAANGGRALLTNLLPGSIGLPGSAAVSYVAVGFDGPTGEFDVYALVFGNGSGYQMVPAAGHFAVGLGGETVKVSDAPLSCVTPTVGVFPLEYCGCAAPKWPWGLVYTASIGLSCNNIGAVPPCKALANWAAA